MTPSTASLSRPPCILLRSGWQVENIGDIAHTPGVLALLEEHFPEAEVIFWPYYVYLPPEEVTMLLKRFPKLRIAEGKLDADGQASTPELAAAIADADLFLHSSGPATIAWADAATFHRVTGRPFGVYGVTYGLYGIPEKKTLDDAAFVYLRDSISLEKARADGVRPSILEFSPDAAFATDVRDDTRAEAFLKAHQLKEGQFLCCIPKHRHTPSWLHVRKNRAFDPVRHGQNEAMAEHDHAPMREAITAVVRQTDLKVLIVHEDETELPIGRDWLLNKLPEDVKASVVWRDIPWLTDEAVSIYVRSAGHFGHEMHSPILCIGQGIPAIVGRWAEQSSKGCMWRDIGLPEWLFDFDQENEIEQYVPAVLKLAEDLPEARHRAIAARDFVRARHAETMAVVRRTTVASVAARTAPGV